MSEERKHNYLPQTTQNFSVKITDSMLFVEQDEAPLRGNHGSTNSSNFAFKSTFSIGGRAGINNTVLTESEQWVRQYNCNGLLI